MYICNLEHNRRVILRSLYCLKEIKQVKTFITQEQNEKSTKNIYADYWRCYLILFTIL